MKIKVQSITPENFAKFGKVVTTPKENPTAQAKEFKFWSDIADYHIDGETEIGLCTVYKQPQIEIVGVERHLKTPEILIPIDAPFILPVLLDGEPDANVQAFQTEIGEAAVINPGVWHGACIPVGKDESSYFVIFRKKTPQEDVVKKPIEIVTLEV